MLKTPRHRRDGADGESRAGEYFRGATDVNTAEGFFSILRCGISGMYHHVSRGHLHRYTSEFEFRHNRRAKLGVTNGARASDMCAARKGA